MHFLVIPRKRISMIEKAEDGDGELLGHLMLTARKVAKEQGLEKVADHSGSQLCDSSIIITHPGIQSGDQQRSGGCSVSLPSAHSCSRRSSAQLAPWLRLISFLGKSLLGTTLCNLLIFLGAILCFCFCTHGFDNYFALFLPLPNTQATHVKHYDFFCFQPGTQSYLFIISEHVDKGGLPIPSGQTFHEVPCIMSRD